MENSRSRKIAIFTIVVLTLITNITFAADLITVKGNITDLYGATVGVNVIVVGSKQGTISDALGNYTIQAPSNGSIKFSFIGFNDKIEQINGRTKIDVILEESAFSLNEVVAIGYGTQKKRDLTGAISSVSNKEIMNTSPTDISQALQGKMAGVQISVNSGEPGADSRFRIRGTSTFTTEGASPLFIVDGMEVASIESINPQDIESIEVLKDAASASIYGSKSANGVIIITTKQGVVGKTQLSINLMSTISKLAHTLPQMNTKQSSEVDELRAFYTGSALGGIADSLNPVNNSDNDYQSILYQPAWSKQLDVSVSGANDKGKYFVSLGLLNDEGIYLNTYNNRISSRINADYKLSDKFSFGTRISLSVSKGKPQDSNSRDFLRRAPNWSMIDPDGSYTAYIASRPNPLAWAYLYKNDKYTYDVIGNAFFEYKLLTDLVFKSTITANLNLVKIDQFKPALLSAAMQRSSKNDSRIITGWTNDNILTYNKTIGDHALNVLAGMSLQDRRFESVTLSVLDNLSESLPISTGFLTVNMNDTKATDTSNRMASWFGRVNYNYLSKYLLSANFRSDGSSRFGSDLRWGVFPSISTGWRFSDEPFMEWTKPAFRDGKLRLSYGVTGNQAAGNFASLALYNPVYYADFVGFSPNQLGNPTLSWETTKQSNAGLDLNFFDGKLNVVVDYYDKTTTGILYNVSIPQTTGFESLYQNVGVVGNKGWEINANGVLYDKKGFNWKAGFNITFNRNNVVSVPGGVLMTGKDGLYTLQDGWTIGTMYGYKAKEIFQWDQSNAFSSDWERLTPVFDDNERFLNYTKNGEVYTDIVKKIRNADGSIFMGGDVYWDDLNKDGFIDTNDRQIIGCGEPDFFGGFTSEWSYKGFSLSVFFNYSIGGDVYNYTEWWRSSGKFANDRISPAIFKNSWIAPGDIATFYKPAAGGAVNNPRESSSLWVEDGSFIRFNNLRFSYALPTKMLTNIKVNSANVYLSVSNLFTWTKYSGYDPEVNSYNSVFAIGWDSNPYPRSRDYILGLNINL